MIFFDSVPMSLEKIRILYVDDDEDDFLLVKTLLHKIRRPSFVLERAASYEEAIDKLGQEYDVFLVDYKQGSP